MLTISQLDSGTATSKIYMALLTHGEMNKDTIMARTGYGRKTVVDCLSALRKSGVLIRRMDPKDGRSYLFRLVKE